VTWRLTLDATAVTAYATGSVHVGELLAEISDEHGPRIAVPTAALITAQVEDADPDRLWLLVGLKPVDVLPLAGDDWHRHATTTRLLGGLDRACAALLHADGRVDYVLTAVPDVYSGIDTIAI
jgi:hypothetical protein